MPDQDADLPRENDWLRKQNRILREREVLKAAHFYGSKAVRFQFVASCRGSLSPSRPCHMTGVADRGLRAWQRRPPSIRQRRDMMILAHIRKQHRQSLGSYGRPRMNKELNEFGIRLGQRRVGRWNGIQVIRGRMLRRSTDSNHVFNIAANLLQQQFRRVPQTRSGRSGR